jgi:hypothetical protein
VRAVPAYVRVGVLAHVCKMTSREMRRFLRGQGITLLRSGRRTYRVAWVQVQEILPDAAERLYDHYVLEAERENDAKVPD